MRNSYYSITRNSQKCDTNYVYLTRRAMMTSSFSDRSAIAWSEEGMIPSIPGTCLSLLGVLGSALLQRVHVSDFDHVLTTLLLTLLSASWQAENKVSLRRAYGPGGLRFSLPLVFTGVALGEGLQTCLNKQTQQTNRHFAPLSKTNYKYQDTAKEGISRHLHYLQHSSTLANLELFQVFFAGRTFQNELIVYLPPVRWNAGGPPERSARRATEKFTGGWLRV